MRKSFIVVLGLLSLSGLASAQDTSSVGVLSDCSIVWDAPILLSDTNYDAHSPKIALSGDDTVHITWENSSLGRPRLPYLRSTNGGSSFLPPRELLADSILYPYSSYWNHIAAEGSKVYVFFVGPGGTYTRVRMIASSTGGETWGDVNEISPDSSGTVWSVSISGQTLSIVYPPRGDFRKILRSTDGGQTWTRTNEDLDYWARVALTRGALHLVQRIVIGQSGEMEYRRSHDLGDTWIETTVLSTVDQFFALDPTIAASPGSSDTTLITAWRDPKYGCMGLLGCSIISRVGTVGPASTVWRPEQVLTNEPKGYFPAVAALGPRFAAAWLMSQEASPYAQVRVSSDTTWCPAFDPAAVPIRAITGIAVALSSKAVHVVWVAHTYADRYWIFYRRGVFKTTDVRDETMPQAVHLEQNYPNPFNATTTIVWRVVSRESVSLRVFDVLGREVASLISGTKEPGRYSVEWNPEGMPSGVYYYRLITADRVETRKAVLMR